MTTLTTKRSLLILAVACFGLFYMGMSSFGVTDPGEGYYVEAAREMVESGDFITPHLNYQIYFSKPILTFWLIAIPYKLIGVSEFSARIAFSLLATLLVYASYLVGRAFKSEFSALFAGLAAASGPLLVAITRLSPIDIAFTCFVDLVVFSFAMSAILGRKHWCWVFHVALALAVLTKGPVGIVLFLAGTLAFLLLVRPSLRQLKLWFLRLKPAFGALIFIAIVLPWYMAIHAATNGLFLRVFFLYENYARFAGHTNLGRSTWWYYLPVIAYGFAPWIAFLPFTVVSIVKSAFEANRAAPAPGSHNSDLSDSAEDVAGDKQLFLIYLLVWGLTEFLFFSCSKTKMDTYIVPSFATFAVCIAVKMEDWLTALRSDSLVNNALQGASRRRKVASLLFNLAAILGCALIVAGPITLFMVVKTDTFGKLVLACAAVVLALGLIFSWRFYLANKLEQAVIAFACGFVLAGSLCQPISFQLSSQKRWDDLKIIAGHLRGTDADLAIFNTFRPAVMFYSRNGVSSFFHAQQLEKLEAGDHTPQRRQLIISSDENVGLLIAQPGTVLKLIERSGEWAVYEAVGARLRRTLVLEEVFRKPQAFKRAISGKSEWGPLTVPYAAGDRHWWIK